MQSPNFASRVTFGLLVAVCALGLPAAVSAAPGPVDGTAEVDEALLSQQLNALAANEPLMQTPLGAARLEQVGVRLADDQVVVRGTARAAWVSLPIELTANASVDAGRVVVHVPEAQVSGIELDESTRQNIEKQLQGRLDATLASQHAQVSSVRISDGRLALAWTQTER